MPPLPKLLYIGDVPVEATYHGSALLYRLLERYPPGRLKVVEGSLLVSQPERRLPNVEYRTLRVGYRRPLFTRLHRWYASWLTLTADRRASSRAFLFPDFEAEGVLSVAHGYSWITAATFAARRGLPLHLVVHDDLPSAVRLISSADRWVKGAFARIYRQAASRFCVSPAMEEEYRRRYGSSGTVLYPSRSIDCTAYPEPPERLSRPLESPTIAFAGTINSAGYVDSLKLLAHALRAVRGRLLLFGPLAPEVAEREGLCLDNVELRGLVTSETLMKRLRDEADALFVPMSFAPGDQANMTLSFPSKLTDYSAVGLPLLIRGPEYCSAVRWARANDGVALVVTDESELTLEAAIIAMFDSAALRVALSLRALEVGAQMFDQARIGQLFEHGLLKASGAPSHEPFAND